MACLFKTDAKALYKPIVMFVNGYIGNENKLSKPWPWATYTTE